MDLTVPIGVAWVVFWVYWLIASRGAKRTTGRRRRPPGFGIGIIAIVLLRIFDRGGAGHLHGPALQVIGALLVAAGFGLAVWARVYLGRNWGMPMSVKDEPELVTSGPYRFIRHPIYTGIALAMVGTGVAVAFYWLILAALIGAFFVYSARVEERTLGAAFPLQYPPYREHTKMLIPFVL